MANRLSSVFLMACLALLSQPLRAVSLSGTVDGDDQPLAEAVISLTALNTKPVASHSPETVSWAMDQKSREFVPHVLVVPRGAVVTFPNSDQIQHHVYSFSPAKHFEIKLYSGLPKTPIQFEQAGIVALGCNIHDWMLGYIYVSDTPHFTQTDVNGHWTLEVPAGQYQLTIWHPDAQPPLSPQSITLTNSQNFQHHLPLQQLGRRTGKPPVGLQNDDYPN